MRTTFDTTISSATTSTKHTLLAPEATGIASSQRSPWHSPVPYLFGGLAAMLGLIAFALLILACSYWRLSRSDDNNERDRDLENGKGDGISKINGPPVYEEKIVVIMAGEDKPTFLATPAIIFTKTSSVLPQQLITKDGNNESSSTTVYDGDKPKHEDATDDQQPQNSDH